MGVAFREERLGGSPPARIERHEVASFKIEKLLQEQWPRARPLALETLSKGDRRGSLCTWHDRLSSTFR
jgi:hypothetical protein